MSSQTVFSHLGFWHQMEVNKGKWWSVNYWAIHSWLSHLSRTNHIWQTMIVAQMEYVASIGAGTQGVTTRFPAFTPDLTPFTVSRFGFHRLFSTSWGCVFPTDCVAHHKLLIWLYYIRSSILNQWSDCSVGVMGAWRRVWDTARASTFLLDWTMED